MIEALKVLEAYRWTESGQEIDDRGHLLMLDFQEANNLLSRLMFASAGVRAGIYAAIDQGDPSVFRYRVENQKLCVTAITQVRHASALASVAPLA